MPPWLMELTTVIQRATGLGDKFNAVNVNYYADGKQACGWHSDRERLFRDPLNGVDIVSLSIGASRLFQIKKYFSGLVKNILLEEDGYLLWMSGNMQTHYVHQIPPMASSRGDRINFTWRIIRNHESSCPCNES